MMQWLPGAMNELSSLALTDPVAQMTPPDFPSNELVRVSLLRSLAILDTDCEERFDRVTRIAQRLFNVPIALVSMVDANRQWFKSCIGLDVRQTPRDISFCGHAILGDDVLLIPDTTADQRFADNPLVTGAPHIRFYAGYPLSLGDGIHIGTLCLKDTVPRRFSEQDLQLLRDLGEMTSQELRAVAAATSDDLTGLLNRRGFLSAAGQALELCRRAASPVAMLYCDLDRFKQINDTFGHVEGDHVLRVFAGMLRSTFRSSDIVARLGGDEFVVMLTNADPATVEAAVRRMEAELAAHALQSQRGYALGCSLGVMSFDGANLPGLDAMLAMADENMYAVKRKNRRHRRHRRHEDNTPG